MPIPLSEDLLDQFAGAEPAPGAAAALDAGDNRLSAQWLAEDGVTPLGEAAPVGGLDYAPREGFGPAGAIAHVVRPVGLVADLERPPEAGFLQLSGAGRAMIIPAAALADAAPLAAGARRRFGRADASFAFPVFAERFADAERFFAAVGALDRWVRTIPPFTEAKASARFAIDAFFWPSDPREGRFQTRDIVYDCAHPPATAAVFLGNNALAKAALNHLMLERRYGLVLINSPVRGGAGGIADHGFPAWASITACPTEVWQAVALHEMGHALGLADEYLDAGRAGEAFGGEPNCARSAAPAAAPWSESFTVKPPGPGSVYDSARQQRVRAGKEPRPKPDFVGLFQGARYSPNYYRAALDCLMKDLSVHRFCPVCAAHVRARLGV